MASGKNKGKPLELVALKDPCFIQDVISSNAKGREQMALRAEARRLVDVFNRRTFGVRCHGRDCDRTATRCSIYKSDVFNPLWWCDSCDPYQYGAGQHRIQIVRTYQDILDFALPFDDPEVAKDLIRVVAKAKGLSPRLGKIQADIFFNG